ncbi:MAG: lysophospholipid acyltransferase family protein [Bacteroidales bacterium]
MDGSWEGKTRGGAFGYLFFIFLIKHCGLASAYTFLVFVVCYFIPFAPKATRSVWIYARNVLGLCIMKSIIFLFRNYYSLGRSLIDKLAVGSGMSDRFNYVFDNEKAILDLLDQRKGAVLIGAHFGNWAMGGPSFMKYGSRLNVVVYDNEINAIKTIIRKNSSDMPSFKVIPVNKDSFAHVFSISEALEANEFVCFQGDRYVNEDKLLETGFMGRKADFPMGPFLVATKFDAPVIFYFAVRLPKRTYKFIFAEASLKETGSSMEKTRYLLNQYVRELEPLVGKYPEQWYNYYDFWKIKKK